MQKFIKGDREVTLVAESRRQKLIEYLTEMGVYGPAFQRVIEFLYEKTDYFYGPSSTKWHAAYPGGGFDHAFGVTECLVELTHKGVCKPWQRVVSPFIVGLLHDVTKLGAYLKRERVNTITGGIDSWYEYNPNHHKLSDIHGEDSLLKILYHMPLTEEEQLCIRWHMGAYEGKDSWAGYDEAIRKFPNVLWTHTADMYASKVMEERNEK